MSPARLRRSLALLGLASILSAAMAAGSGAVVLASDGGHEAARAAASDQAAPAGDRQVGQRKNSGPALLIDHGGPVLLGSHTVAIYWGSGFPSELQGAMAQLLGGFDGSAYLGVAQQYMRTTTTLRSHYDGALLDTSAPPNHAPQPNGLGNEVAKLVANPDPSTIYIVYTSNFPNINYCAYHASATANGVVVQVAYVPLQPHGCSPLSVSNLNANSYSDTTQANADSTAHEFMEAVTDPHLNAWYDKNGAEVADKCNYDYISVVHLANRSTWQIQAEWSNALGACDQGAGR